MSPTRHIKVWLKAARIPFSTATLIPVALGSIIAWRDTGEFMWMRFWLVTAGALLMHMGTNLVNDYFDHLSGCDKANPNPTPFSGGSRVIQQGLIPAGDILRVSLISFTIGSAIGLYLNYLSGGNVILILGIIGVFLGFFYSAKPLSIGYGSLGELATGLGFGPLMVLGAYYVQAQNLILSVFLASIPIGMLIALVLFINEFPDYEADKSVNKRTLVVILGKKNAAVLYYILLAVVYLVIVALVVFKFLPYACLIALLSLPLALKAFLTLKKNYDKINELLPANALTIGLHFITGLLLCAGFILDKIF